MIADLPEYQGLLVYRRGCRVLKALVQPFSATRKYGTRFLCVVANREDVIELLAGEFIYRLRAASCDVDSDLRHRRDGIRIEADGTRTRAEYLELIASDMSPFLSGMLPLTNAVTSVPFGIVMSLPFMNKEQRGCREKDQTCRQAATGEEPEAHSHASA